MKIWQKFLVSSTILAGLICVMGAGVFRLYQAEIAAQKAQKSAAYARKITYRLEKSLQNQALVLKDFVVLDHNIAHMIKFQNTRSNFLVDLKELELLMDGAVKEISFVYRRHYLLTNLANTLDRNNNRYIAQQDLQAINSYIQDITLYLNDISDIAEQHNYAAISYLERIRYINPKEIVLIYLI
ncbi:MAG: PAS domain-containing sensor histidine kinase, partial [Sphaerospermopsis sp. SIO1G2]|nr:PAS domain-containing sensor histidine kinase [Sphaerospermopsis sp. SIO1G2]